MPERKIDSPNELVQRPLAPERRQLVYVVDDDDECRSSLQRRVQSLGYEVAAFASAEEFLDHDRCLGAGLVECAVVDFRLQGMSGLELQEVLRQRAPGLPLILLSGVAPFATAAEAMRKGVVALLEKPVRREALQRALEEAFDRPAVPPSAQGQETLMEQVRRVRRLSSREREVAQLVAQGQSNKEIAKQLHLSEKTIEKYRANCVKKLLAKSSTEMVRAVVMAQMLRID